MSFQTFATNFFHCFSVSFLTYFVHGRKLSKYLVTRSFLALSAHKSNIIYNRIQNIWFSLPTYFVLQLQKQCLRKNMVLLNFCPCVYKCTRLQSVFIYLTLSLPIFWQFCSLSATFILNIRGIVESQAFKFSKKKFFQPFLSITFNKYPKFEVSKSKIRCTLHNVSKQRDLNNVRGGGPGRRSATLAVWYDVADRRRWQWKS